MPTLTDARFDALRAAGYNGATSDMLLQWLQANDGGAGITNIPDGWATMLGRYASLLPVQRNDDWYDLLGIMGYEGALNDRELAFWQDGGNLPPLIPGFIYTITVGTNEGSLRGFRAPADPTSPPNFGQLLPRRWDNQPGTNPLSRFTVNPSTDLLVLGSLQRTQWLGATQLSMVVENFDSETPFTLDWNTDNSDYRGSPPGLGAYFDAGLGNLLGVNIVPVDPVEDFLIGTNNEPLVTENGEYLEAT